MRVGIISLNHESNTFVSGRTTIEDFLADRLFVGSAACRKADWGNHEVGGFVDGLNREGVEPVPLMIGWALPGSIIAAKTYEKLLDLLLSELVAVGRLDGLLLAPHGAAVSEDVLDVDGDWIGRVREQVGPNLPIIATLDPHANVSPSMVAATDALIAYRTNPHLDQRDRGIEAAMMMAETLKGKVNPVQAAALIPLIINIERQHTVELPILEIENATREIAARKGMLSSSVILGFPYADVPEMGSGAIVVADRSREMAAGAASELGQLILAGREYLKGHLIDSSQALMLAATLPGPVCLLDMGDNVGGGSPGDGTTLARLLDQSGKRAFVCLHDPAAVARAFDAGIGARLNAGMGGHSGDPYGPPLSGPAVVRHLSDGKFTDPRPRHGGTTHYDIGKTAVVELAGGLTVMLTTRRAFPVSIVQLTSCGLDPKKFEIIVAKGVHAPVTAYAEACNSFVRVNTLGVTSADLSKFAYLNRRRPLYPFEQPPLDIDQFIYPGNNRV